MENAVSITMERASLRAERDQIIASCQEGDREAFRLLFELHQERVYSIALHFTGDRHSAHDIAQQVFLKLITNIGQYNFQSEFMTWLYRIIANTCFDEQKKWRRWIPFGDEAELHKLPGPANVEDDFSRNEIGDSVRAAIGELKPKLRMPILLKYLEGLSYEEIGKILHCSPGTVASRLNRGHKALAVKLEHLRSASNRGI